MRIVRKGRSKNVFLVIREQKVLENGNKQLFWCPAQRMYFYPPYIIAFAIPINATRSVGYYYKINFILTSDYKDII